MQYLYLIECQNFCKIGIANDVEHRLAQLSTGNPFPLDVLAVYGYDNANAVETVLHQRFSGLRTRGEWFSLTANDVSVFHQICQLLGGVANTEVPTVEEEEIEEAEELAEATEGGKWDFAAMFADGWRMEKTTNGRHVGGGSRYWCWRKGSDSIGKKYIYGGVIADLPRSVEDMRKVYKPLAQGESVGNV